MTLTQQSLQQSPYAHSADDLSLQVLPSQQGSDSHSCEKKITVNKERSHCHQFSLIKVLSQIQYLLSNWAIAVTLWKITYYPSEVISDSSATTIESNIFQRTEIIQRMPFCLLELPEQDTIDWWLQQQKFIISEFYRLEVQTQSSSQVRFWEGHSSQLCRQLPSRYVLRWLLFSVDGLIERARKLPGVSSLKSNNPVRSEAHPSDCIYLNYLPRGPICRYSYTGGQGFNI